MRVHDTVRTTERLGRRDFIADKANKALRRVNAPGVIVGILGRCDERYLVKHEGESIAAVYIRQELVPEPNAYWTVLYSQAGYTCFTEVATYKEVEGLLDELAVDGFTVVVEGPCYSDKVLTEGLLPSRSLFEHLKDKD